MIKINNIHPDRAAPRESQGPERVLYYIPGKTRRTQGRRIFESSFAPRVNKITRQFSLWVLYDVVYYYDSYITPSAEILGAVENKRNRPKWGKKIQGRKKRLKVEGGNVRVIERMGIKVSRKERNGKRSYMLEQTSHTHNRHDRSWLIHRTAWLTLHLGSRLCGSLAQPTCSGPTNVRVSCRPLAPIVANLIYAHACKSTIL